MKKIFINDKFYGNAIKICRTEKEIIFTFVGDFPGMAERNIVIPSGKILYEDDDRLYATY